VFVSDVNHQNTTATTERSTAAAVSRIPLFAPF